MLNLVMTHSPRIAAITNNKRFGEDATTNHSIRHRIAWMRKPVRATALTHAAPEAALRERTA